MNIIFLDFGMADCARLPMKTNKTRFKRSNKFESTFDLVVKRNRRPGVRAFHDLTVAQLETHSPREPFRHEVFDLIFYRPQWRNPPPFDRGTFCNRPRMRTT